MSPDPRAPVLIGLGEVVRRPGDDGPTEPAALMAEAIHAALADAGTGDAPLRAVRALAAIPSAAWPDGDPARRVLELLGPDRVGGAAGGVAGAGVHTLRTSMQGGNGPLLALNELAARIAAGRLDAAVVCGAEALRTVARRLKDGDPGDWPAADPDRRPDEVLEEDRAAGTEAEAAVGMIAPLMAYPLIENALRVASGRTPAEHLERIAGLWSRFSTVAAGRAAAWSPRTYDAAFLETPSRANRRVTLPYTKLLNANLQVDQAAAVLLCSAGTAAALGVARDRWVFLHAGARATDEWYLSERRALHRSPAIAACGQAVLTHVGLRAEDLGPVDLYSCFPAAVQLAADALGLPIDDPGRPLTATGGLTFFGGPGNDYATHGLIAVAQALREAPAGTVGLSTALGWYATKHAVTLLGGSPPLRPYAAFDAEPGPVAPREVAPPQDADATAETCTLIYDREGAPAYGILFALEADGRRALGKTDDPDVMAAMEADDFLGGSVRLRADRSFSPG